jgi:hypothetical protein
LLRKERRQHSGTTSQADHFDSFVIADGRRFGAAVQCVERIDIVDHGDVVATTDQCTRQPLYADRVPAE